MRKETVQVGGTQSQEQGNVGAAEFFHVKAREPSSSRMPDQGEIAVCREKARLIRMDGQWQQERGLILS